MDLVADIHQFFVENGYHREDHPTTRVQVGNQTADIDTRLAPIIEMLWKLGVSTLESCQEHIPGICYILFQSCTEFQKFVKILSSHHRAIYKLQYEWGSEITLIKPNKGVDFNIPVFIYFPQDDIPILEEALRRTINDTCTSQKDYQGGIGKAKSAFHKADRQDR